MVATTLKDDLNAYYRWTFAVLNDQVYAGNGWDIGQMWDGQHDKTLRWGIDAPGSAPTAYADPGAPSGNVGAGVYYYRYTYARMLGDDILVESNPSPAAQVTLAHSGRVRVTIAMPDVSLWGEDGAYADINRVYIWRTRNGDSSAYYRVGYIDEYATSKYTDTAADASLPIADALFWLRGEHGLPVRAPYCLGHRGRLYLAGQRVHRQGTVRGTAGGTALTPASADESSIMDGRRNGPLTKGWDIRVPYLPAVMRVRWVHVGAIHLTTTVPATFSASTYTATGRARSDIYWSEANGPDYWYWASRAVVGQQGDNGITGLFATIDGAGITKRNRTYRWRIDDRPIDGTLFDVGVHRGSVSQQTTVSIEGVQYMLDEYGMHILSGDQSQSISQPIRQIIRESGASRRINWGYEEEFHAVYDIENDRILWFVVMGNDYEAHDALVFNRERSAWSWEHYQQAITASASGLDSRGMHRVFVGTASGHIYALGYGYTDGASPYSTLAGTATGGSATTLVDAAASFQTSLAGAYAWLTHAGTGAVETARIISATATALYMATSWATAPAAGDTYQIGAIETYDKTGLIDVGREDFRKRFCRMTVAFEPTAADIDVVMRVYLDQAATPFSTWAKSVDRLTTDGYKVVAGSGDITFRLSKADGAIPLHFGAYHRYCQLYFRSVGACKPYRIRSLRLWADDEEYFGT